MARSAVPIIILNGYPAKCCTVCNTVKMLTDYYFNSHTGRHQSRCKVCVTNMANDRMRQKFAELSTSERKDHMDSVKRRYDKRYKN